MSVELTGNGIGVLSVKPLNDQGNDHQPIKNIADQAESIENKSIGIKTSEEELRTYQPSEKDKENDKDKDTITTPQLEKVAEQLQAFIGKMNRGLEFIVDEDSGRDVIKVIDKNSGDTIKQYPSEEVLSLVAKLSEATGNFVDSEI